MRGCGRYPRTDRGGDTLAFWGFLWVTAAVKGVLGAEALLGIVELQGSALAARAGCGDSGFVTYDSL
eukprot:scaffold230554_cov35-Tisochrysis_lutea.AAC.2